MATVLERSTNAPIRSVGYEYNKPVASADLNEAQSVIINSISGFLNGKLNANEARIGIEGFTDNNGTGIIVTNIKYAVCNSNNVVFLGSINPSMILKYPGSPQVGSSYDIYAYWRTLDLDPSSTVYTNGIRTNSSQTSIVESTTPNNILDVNLNEEVSVRKSIEFTFVVVIHNSAAPTLSGWSSAVKISTVTLGSGLAPTLVNAVPASSIDEHLKSEMPHVFTDGSTLYKYGLSVVNNHMVFNYEEV